ncbi:MAG TPA: hypothetical protein VKR58_09575 [Aquella sp.]|nr:hypothetical protein [Aquella sp.]
MTLFVIQGCIGGFGLDIKDHLVGIYYLAAADDDRQCSLTTHEPSDGGNYGNVVNQTVFAVGYNEKYIIAKQHPDENRKITNYFIVPVEQHITRENLKNLMGPLTYDQFLAKRHELSIPDSLQFTKEYENLK